MFGGGRTSGSLRRGGALSVIGADVVINGHVTTMDDLHVDGTIEGDVDCGTLIQGASSSIRGVVKAKSARLGGTIDGSVVVAALTIERTARINGDVSYETLAIDAGAQVDGKMTHGTTGGTNVETPLRLTALNDADD